MGKTSVGSTLLLLLCVAGCGTAGDLPQDPVLDPPPDETPPLPGYPLVLPPPVDPALFVCEPFNYDDTSYPQGLHGQEGGFGFSGPWNDADADVQDRVIGNHALSIGSDMAPPSTGGRTVHWGTTGSGIYRDLDRTYGTDGTTVWVSYRWISTDAAAQEGLQVVDFNTDSGAFGLVVGQVRGLADDDAFDGMYEIAHHPARLSADIGVRDQGVHFVLLRFTFGAGDVDTVDLWWDPERATFDPGTPTATLAGVDATFDRVTIRSGSGADSLDELRIGATLASVTEVSLRVTSYHIGNSLTWDSQPDGLEALAGQWGQLHDTGHHIRCGQSLKAIWDVPDDTCVAPVGEYGPFLAALPNHTWSAICMQPFPGASSTLGTDERVILDMIAVARQNPANSGARFYVYASWPEHDYYASSWTMPVADSDGTPTVQARAYFRHLIERVRGRTAARVYVIPVGEVLYVLDQRLRAGAVAGFGSVADLYRDDIHLTHDVGRFVAAVTTVATLYARDPRDIVKPVSYYGSDPSIFTPELYDVIHDVVWMAVSEHPYTGITN